MGNRSMGNWSMDNWSMDNWSMDNCSRMGSLILGQGQDQGQGHRTLEWDYME